MPSSTPLSPAELSYLHSSLSSHPPIRPDSRTATDFRPLNAETGVLPNTMGSAHVGFADGREAVVGVRAEVEKTKIIGISGDDATSADGGDDDNTNNNRGADVGVVVDAGGRVKGRVLRGKADWVTLGLTLPGTRDDDKEVVFLEEMLRETLVAFTSTSVSVSASAGPGAVAVEGQRKQDEDEEVEVSSSARSLQDALVVNFRWHWHLYIDVLLISAPDRAGPSSAAGQSSGAGASYPLPLLSMAVHLALRDTRLPRLKSEGDEDPVADDDWDAAGFLYTRGMNGGLLRPGLVPPVTLLVMVVAENVIFDPSSTELAVADGVLAISVGRESTNSTGLKSEGDASDGLRILAVRTLETPARDTMKGVPRDAVEGEAGIASGTDLIVPGVWKPKVGGIKRTVLMKVVKAVVGSGVGKEVLDGLNGFLAGS